MLTLADEVLTSDSSRYWDAEAWRTGTTPAERMASFDKQIVRDWLAANWDKQGEPPALPAEIVERTADRYRELLELPHRCLTPRARHPPRSQRTRRYRDRGIHSPT